MNRLIRTFAKVGYPLTEQPALPLPSFERVIDLYLMWGTNPRRSEFSIGELTRLLTAPRASGRPFIAMTDKITHPATVERHRQGNLEPAARGHPGDTGD
jgi:hypothetical protein